MQATVASVLAAVGSVSALRASPKRGRASRFRIIVPFPSRRRHDIIAREASAGVATATRWTFIIDNKPGAGGNLGVDAVAKAPADGYTLVLGQTSNLAINPSLYSKLPYDPQKDLAPIGLLANAPLSWSPDEQSPYKTLADAVNAGAKAKPAQVNFASPGNGTVAHLTSEMFQKSRRHHDAARAVQGCLAGAHGRDQRQCRSCTCRRCPTLLRQIKQGKLRPLAVTSEQACRRPAADCRRSARPATRDSTPSPGSVCLRPRQRRRT
jgi:tripartite-type tricarboxylate transporter receptor subunit TctC